MILEIKFDKGEGLNLYVDGQSEHLFFDYSTRVEALRNANNRFDTCLMQAASLYPDENKGAFLWCYTSALLRNEEVADLIRLYFLMELVKKIGVENQVKKFILSYDIPTDAIVELRSLNLKISKSLGFYNGKMREFIKVFYHASNSIQRNFISFLNRKNPIFYGNLLDVNQSPTNNRLDSIDNFEFYKPYSVFSGQEHKILGFNEGDVVVFRNENSLFDGIIQLCKAVELSIFIKQNRSRLPNVYRSYFRFRDVFRLWCLLLYKRGAEKYFKRNEIKNLVHVSTLTKPEYRILWAKAREYKVNVTVVASRTLKTLSSSERLIEADIKAFSNTSLPDNFIVRDEFSKDAFKAFYFWERVKIGGRFERKDVNYELESINERVIYIVLTHIKECSEYLLKELGRVDFKSLGIHKVFYRCHPSNKFTYKEIHQCFPEYEVFNHTGLAIQQCNYDDILMISGPTTGALELVKKGVTLFWFPYIWKDGVLFDDIMKKYGIMCDALEKFNEYLSACNKIGDFTSIDFNQTIDSSFTSKKLISRQLKSLISNK